MEQQQASKADATVAPPVRQKISNSGQAGALQAGKEQSKKSKDGTTNKRGQGKGQVKGGAPAKQESAAGPSVNPIAVASASSATTTARSDSESR